MDSYIKYLIFVGLFVTIITIILFFVMYNYSEPKSKWPPESNTCPDYWTIRHESSGPVCYDTLRMSPNDDDGAVFNPNTVLPASFSEAEPEEWGGIPANGLAITYNDGGASGSASAQIKRGNEAKPFGSASEWATHCGKRKWAQHNGITWDGITNSNIDCTSYKGSEPDNTLFDG
tara:strand:+ start:7948 stop:8472 length:525 start_codon:yes stop_codon:yes gene_type:complete